YMWTHPGAKLLFMGNEFGQTSEWNYKSELQWHLLQFDPHKKLQACVSDLNNLLRDQPALYANQFNEHGFEWVDLNHRDNCVMVYRRKGKEKGDDLLVLLNLNPIPKDAWEVMVDREYSEEVFNSDDVKYWGTGNYGNESFRCELVVPETLASAEKKSLEKEEKKKYKLTVKLPPLAGIVLK
ncbi:MAG TPA: alpha amylase C-terminal domain-containing protein, partial [Flavisolibacter sp.]|nr:alpha amylase C-terminal domain-containing protein [Flavisolibacter sp.]